MLCATPRITLGSPLISRRPCHPRQTESCALFRLLRQVRTKIATSRPVGEWFAPLGLERIQQEGSAVGVFA